MFRLLPRYNGSIVENERKDMKTIEQLKLELAAAESALEALREQKADYYEITAADDAAEAIWEALKKEQEKLHGPE